jgi:hypothetical protein
LVLGIGADPLTTISARDRTVLHSLGAAFIVVNAPSADRSVVRLECREPSFLDWARRHRLGSVLVRSDRFIAERVASRADLRSLNPFANAASAMAIEPTISATAA